MDSSRFKAGSASSFRSVPFFFSAVTFNFTKVINNGQEVENNKERFISGIIDMIQFYFNKSKGCQSLLLANEADSV